MHEAIHGKKKKKDRWGKDLPETLIKKTKGAFTEDLLKKYIPLGNKNNENKKHGIFFAREGDQADQMKKYMHAINPSYLESLKK